MPSASPHLPRIGVPPIKCQGIKTKLVPFILSQISWQETSEATWIEPFLGSGVVAFNRLPHQAILADTNPHIIRFYQAIQQGTISRASVQKFLAQEGETLRQQGADYYYQVRDRFNQTSSPLDFLFLNRACFNGLMRFNSNGKFNVPFCQKPQRFSQSYITKISNQVSWVAQCMTGKDWKFCVSDWQKTLHHAKPNDYVYLDPPYIGRHADYHNQWSLEDAEKLAAIAQQLPCGFAVSMWLENRYRQNEHIQQHWADLDTRTQQHFYHVGSHEALRSAMTEALIIRQSDSHALK
jgi:DNA adenine methylase